MRLKRLQYSVKQTVTLAARSTGPGQDRTLAPPHIGARRIHLASFMRPSRSSAATRTRLCAENPPKCCQPNSFARKAERQALAA
jgi:hypothetical protein